MLFVLLAWWLARIRVECGIPNANRGPTDDVTCGPIEMAYSGRNSIGNGKHEWSWLYNRFCRVLFWRGAKKKPDEINIEPKEKHF